MRKLVNRFRGGKHVNFLIFPDQGKGIRFRISSAFAFFLLGVSGFFLVLVLLFMRSLAEIPYKAFLAESLVDENQRLRSYNARVVELERELSEYRDLASRIAELAGVEEVFFDRSPGWKGGMVLAEDAAGQVAEEVPPVSLPDLAQDGTGADEIPHGLPLDGWISKEFIQDPVSVGGSHPGIDLAGPEGKEVRTTASGVVRLAGWDDYYGNLIVIDHQNGYETYYGHNSKLAVSKGEIVKRGQVIALSGNTGRSTAPHLHYEIRKHGKAVNPRDYLGIEDEKR